MMTSLRNYGALLAMLLPFSVFGQSDTSPSIDDPQDFVLWNAAYVEAAADRLYKSLGDKDLVWETVGTRNGIRHSNQHAWHGDVSRRRSAHRSRVAAAKATARHGYRGWQASATHARRYYAHTAWRASPAIDRSGRTVPLSADQDRRRAPAVIPYKIAFIAAKNAWFSCSRP